ncbi:MAG: hypothetical protein EXR85_06290 [Xanthomonadales bacterium]|nr:hypothetical protein [Xanthomonadales bacterium]
MLNFKLCVASAVLLISCTVQAAQIFVYPAKGQSKDQQKQDEGACMSWASEQTGFNPAAQMTPTSPPPPQTAPTSSVGKGLLTGALVGVAVGAIAGNAGKGAAIGAASGALVGGMSKHQQQQQQAQQQQAWANQQAANYAQQQANFSRAYTVCLQGREYTVSQ